VHDGCYLDTNHQCDEDTYNGLLDECNWNEYFAQNGVTPGAPEPLQFTGPPMSQRDVAKLRRLIRQKHGASAALFNQPEDRGDRDSGKSRDGGERASR